MARAGDGADGPGAQLAGTGAAGAGAEAGHCPSPAGVGAASGPLGALAAIGPRISGFGPSRSGAFGRLASLAGDQGGGLIPGGPSRSMAGGPGTAGLR